MVCAANKFLDNYKSLVESLVSNPHEVNHFMNILIIIPPEYCSFVLKKSAPSTIHHC